MDESDAAGVERERRAQGLTAICAFRGEGPNSKFAESLIFILCFSKSEVVCDKSHLLCRFMEQAWTPAATVAVLCTRITCEMKPDSCAPDTRSIQCWLKLPPLMLPCIWHDRLRRQCALPLSVCLRHALLFTAQLKHAAKGNRMLDRQALHFLRSPCWRRSIRRRRLPQCSICGCTTLRIQ